MGEESVGRASKFAVKVRSTEETGLSLRLLGKLREDILPPSPWGTQISFRVTKPTSVASLKGVLIFWDTQTRVLEVAPFSLK